MNDLHSEKKTQPLDQSSPQFEMWEVVVDTKLGRICGRSTRIAIFLIFVVGSLALVVLGLSKDNLSVAHLGLIIGFGLLIAVVMLIVIFKKEGLRAASSKKNPCQTSEPGDAH